MIETMQEQKKNYKINYIFFELDAYNTICIYFIFYKTRGEIIISQGVKCILFF